MAKSPGSCKDKEGRSSKSQQVRIDIGGQVSWMDEAASCDPSVTALVLPQLEYELTVTEQTGPLGHEEHKECLTLHDLRLGKQGAFPTGLVPRIALLLTEHGYRVKIVDHREYNTSGFAVDKKLLRALDTEDLQLAKAVLREPLGRVEVKNFGDLIDMMRLIIELYPNARTLIPVATKQMGWQIARKLTEATDFKVRILGRAWPEEPPRCMVCTFKPINACRVEDWDLILLPDAMQCKSQRGAAAMAHFNGPYDRMVWRVYSFLQAGVQLGYRERILLEGICGEVIYRRLPAHARVRVLWLPGQGCAQIPRDATALVLKRKAYWHNARRNDFIAGVARAFARQDAQKLRKYGVAFDGDKPVLRHAPHPKLVLLVASTEQARELAKRLPNWQVLTQVPNKSENGDTSEEQPGRIITQMWAAKHGLEADVLIRAGGSAGKLCLKGLPPVLETAEQRAVIVLDFDDQFDQRAARDTRSRVREYESLGWDAESVPGKRGTNLHNDLPKSNA